jgi:hypothetical protein
MPETTSSDEDEPMAVAGPSINVDAIPEGEFMLPVLEREDGECKILDKYLHRILGH